MLRGFTDLKDNPFAGSAGNLLGFRDRPADKSRISQSVYSSRARPLHRLQNFQPESIAEVALIPERHAAR